MFSNSVNKSIFIYLSFSGTNLLLCVCVGQTVHTISFMGSASCINRPLWISCIWTNRFNSSHSLARMLSISLCAFCLCHMWEKVIYYIECPHTYTLMRCIYTREWYHFSSLFKLTTQINSRKCLSRVQNTRKCHCQSNAYFTMSIENPMSKQNVYAPQTHRKLFLEHCEHCVSIKRRI